MVRLICTEIFLPGISTGAGGGGGGGGGGMESRP